MAAKTIGVDENSIVCEKISHKTDKHQPETFQPVYKISCAAGGVKYKLRIDAISGNVLKIDVG